MKLNKLTTKNGRIYLTKYLLRWGLNLSVFYVLTGCGGTSGSHENWQNTKSIVHSVPTDTLNIIGHWLHEGRRENLVRELVNEFEFLHQNCKVNLVFPDQIYWDRSKKNCEYAFNAKQMTAPRSDWDIIRIQNGYSEQANYMHDPLWPKKYLVDMSQYPQFVNNTLPELVSDSAKKRWQGIIPGPFLEGFNWCIWYNQSLANEMGIKVKPMGMTFDDLLGYIKAIDRYNTSHQNQVIPIMECGDWSTINVLTQSLYLSEMGGPGNCKMKTCRKKNLDALRKVLMAIQELAKYHAYSPDYKQIIWNKTEDYPLKHKCFFYVNASWMYNIWQGIDPKEVNNMIPAELPVFKPCPSYFGGYFCTWAIPKNAPHREEAVKFFLFLTRPGVAEKWARYTKCSTGIKGNLTTVNFGADHFEDFTYNIQKKYGSHKIPWVDDASLILGTNYTNARLFTMDVATGKITASEAMEKIRKELIQ